MPIHGPSHPLSHRPGNPSPMGATVLSGGTVNFAIYSQYAHAVELCLFTNPQDRTLETHRLALTARRGDTWHIEVSGIPEGSTYGYRIDGAWEPSGGQYFNPHKLLLDPYARHIDGLSQYHPSLKSQNAEGNRDTVDSAANAPRAFVPCPDDYNWEGDAPLCTPMADTVITELHVKGFSKLNPAVPETLRGTYAGLAHPASTNYLCDLGITAVQLLPVHQHLDDGFLLDRGLVNYWGYNTLGFFAPETRYAASNDPVTEFRDMVKALHRAGLEVILDVVYNHTCEAGKEGPTCFFRGIDNVSYYHTDPAIPGNYADFTGCGNSVDVSHSNVLRLVMDSLRYWVQEMHVDGFRFDLAVELGRTFDSYSSRAAFFQAVHQDPVVGQVKLIAEPWDLGYGGYQIGNFPIDWAELNGKFRDGVRRFWRGDPGLTGELAARFTGSQDLFSHNRRTSTASVNFITSHDGFTLMDLVSYNEKHNLENGEKNADGDSHNISFNHGVEGPTDDPLIIELRHRQVRNFLATVICSQGVPFLLSGDERFRSQFGNNNGYCQDNQISWMNWSDSAEAIELREFVKRLLKLRRDFPSLRRNAFFTGEKFPGDPLPDICWLRPDGGLKKSLDWTANKPGSFSILIDGSYPKQSLLFFFNACPEMREFQFPRQPLCSWTLIVDTTAPLREGGISSSPETVCVSQRSMQIWTQADQENRKAEGDEPT